MEQTIQSEPITFADDLIEVIRDLAKTAKELHTHIYRQAGQVDMYLRLSDGTIIRKARLQEQRLSDGSRTYDIVLEA